MSRRDEDPDSAVEGLLQKYEREEAAVLKAELVEFLKSAEARAQLEQTVRKPVEEIVLAALSNPKFQEQVRDTVIASLKPEITKAVQAAMKDVKVTIPPETQAQMRRDADEVVRSAHAAAQREALGGGARPRAGGMSQNDKLVLGGFVAVVLAAAGFVFWITRRDRAELPPVVSASTETTAPSFETTTTPAAPRGSALFETYRAALDQVGPPGMASPSSEEMACIDTAIRRIDQAPLDVARLRALLNGCPSLGSKPTGASRIIVGVQAQLTEESRSGSCLALKPVTIDGLHGNETSAALSTYVGCTGPAGVPKRLDTLGDYAAVGVYFIDKRMRDAG